MDIFKYHKPLKDYHVKIYEIDDYFQERYKEKIKYDKNGHKYILFKTDIYFSDYSLVIDFDGKEDEDENKDKDLILELKNQSALDEKLDCDFIRINPFRDLNHDISRIQKFIDDFKDNKIKDEIKELKDEMKEPKDKIRKLKYKEKF